MKMFEDMFEMQYSELQSIANEADILEKSDEISLLSKIVLVNYHFSFDKLPASPTGL
jgi:hypothetical protein